MSKLRLNLGSGQRRFGTHDHPWTNVDINPKWEPDIISDCANLPMIPDGSVEIAVAHHVCEHYGCGEAEGLLREAHRVLQPGGSLLVFVPDMWALAGAWREGRITDQIYFTNVYGAYMNDEADRHKFGYTKNSLYASLMPIFGRVVMFDWRTIAGADIAKDWWILGVEAIR